MAKIIENKFVILRIEIALVIKRDDVNTFRCSMNVYIANEKGCESVDIFQDRMKVIVQELCILITSICNNCVVCKLHI